jgi:hypothetical protein
LSLLLPVSFALVALVVVVTAEIRDQADMHVLAFEEEALERVGSIPMAHLSGAQMASGDADARLMTRFGQSAVT